MMPLGFYGWLAGVKMVSRSSPKAAYKYLSQAVTEMKQEKSKLCFFPEGTRNSCFGLLPFKRGAFKTAIMGQVPIMPLVLSPYYFIDHKRRQFDQGHVILRALEPISTQGMVEADHVALMDKTRSLMLAEYEKLAAEVTLRDRLR